jgi:hypothetical protein
LVVESDTTVTGEVVSPMWNSLLKEARCANLRNANLHYADRHYAKAGNLVDLSSHNANPPGVFDGEAVPLSDVADTRIEESVAALREFVAEHGSLPTAESWTEAAMRPSEKTIRRRFGSFREAIKRSALT